MVQRSTCERKDKIIHVLDIRNDVCPMTFVKTRLLIERMAVGDVATVLLRGAEPIENVPASVAELGHAILEMAPARLDTDCAEIQAGDMRLRIRKK